MFADFVEFTNLDAIYSINRNRVNFMRLSRRYDRPNDSPERILLIYMHKDTEDTIDITFNTEAEAKVIYDLIKYGNTNTEAFAVA